MCNTAPQLVSFLDRDHSILAFNERVLDWAYRPDVPLLERRSFLTIVSSDLDEFFEVRVGRGGAGGGQQPAGGRREGARMGHWQASLGKADDAFVTVA
jgi:hypothetical protein